LCARAQGAAAPGPPDSLGGVNQLTAFDFIMAGATAIGVGGELLPKEALHFRQEDRIRELAGRFIGTVRDARALADTYY
jgi:2-dehydro-3-deoxyphosphogluconate aldolase / (4S)-4-hydroxy-2-oxoglutarate aldolase